MKRREFWIEYGGDPSLDGELYKRYSATKPFKPIFPDVEVIHCREVLLTDCQKCIQNEFCSCDKAPTDRPTRDCFLSGHILKPNHSKGYQNYICEVCGFEK